MPCAASHHTRNGLTKQWPRQYRKNTVAVLPAAISIAGPRTRTTCGDRAGPEDCPPRGRHFFLGVAMWTASVAPPFAIAPEVHSIIATMLALKYRRGGAR